MIYLQQAQCFACQFGGALGKIGGGCLGTRLQEGTVGVVIVHVGEDHRPLLSFRR